MCPICSFGKSTNLLNLNCGNIDGSTLYKTAKILVCLRCGHVYNRLSSREISGLLKYYNEEYAASNLGSTDKVGDRPGNNNRFTFERYSRLYRLILPYLKRDVRLLDAGCATGGFLEYLWRRKLKNLYGIDISEKYINFANKKDIYDVRLGSIESIPFNRNSLDIIVMDQVLEHLVDPHRAFREARRVLSGRGLFCISVPDASRYGRKHLFDFFWFLLREHIQHFDIEHLEAVARINGFKLIFHTRYETPMMSEKMILPVLSVVFRLDKKENDLKITKDCFKLKNYLSTYIENNTKRLKNKIKIINNLAISQKPIFAWGIGREFMYLYGSAGLNKCNLVGLIDNNPHKQKTYSIRGRRISDKSILKKTTLDSVLIISATAHTESIKKDLRKIGYKGKVLKI